MHQPPNAPLESEFNEFRTDGVCFDASTPEALLEQINDFLTNRCTVRRAWTATLKPGLACKTVDYNGSGHDKTLC